MAWGRDGVGFWMGIAPVGEVRWETAIGSEGYIVTCGLDVALDVSSVGFGGRPSVDLSVDGREMGKFVLGPGHGCHNGFATHWVVDVIWSGAGG